MKKIILTFLFLTFCIPVIHADDFFDNYMGIDRAWDGQKAITNKEFEEAINVLEGNKKQKEEKQRKKKVKKISGGGTSLHSFLDPNSEIRSQDSLKPKDKSSGELLNIPVSIVVENTVLEPGFYNISLEKDKTDNKLYISFYQAHSFLGKVPAYETEDDFDADTIDFVKFIPYNDNFLKIICGTLDYNAYAYVQFYEQNE